MRLSNRKMIVFGILLGFIVIGNIALKPPDDEKPVYKNLKVFSNKITDEKMDQVMDIFDRELGVTCDYCHDADRSSAIPKPDFANDRNPQKGIAREMLKMTINLNRKYFGIKANNEMTVPVRIWCGTCHRGLTKPYILKKNGIN